MKKNLVSAIIISALVAMAPAAFAGNNKEKVKTENSSNAKTSGNIQLQYVSEENNLVVLKITVNKGDLRPAVLRITDGTGELLITERFSDKSFTKLIKVSTDELKTIELIFDTAEGTTRKRYNLNVSTVSTFQMEEVIIK